MQGTVGWKNWVSSGIKYGWIYTLYLVSVYSWIRIVNVKKTVKVPRETMGKFFLNLRDSKAFPIWPKIKKANPKSKNMGEKWKC